MEHVYLVCYDIAEPKRWRKVYRAMKGYGSWLQLSVFQCRMGRKNWLLMTETLKALIHEKEDHVLIIDMGPADTVKIRVQSFGRSYEPVTREAMII